MRDFDAGYQNIWSPLRKKEVLVLEGGGVLGVYQAGAYEALCDAGHMPSWVAGTSIGAIDAAIIAGKPPKRRASSCANLA